MAEYPSFIRNSLLESEAEMFKSLVEHHPDAIFAVDLLGEVMFANPNAELFFGYALGELQAMRYAKLVPVEDRLRAADYFEQTLQGQPNEYEMSMLHKEGYKIEALVTNVPIFVNGQTVGVYVIVKDITARKKAEEELRISEANLAFAQAMAKMGNWEYDIRNNRITGSAENFRIYGLEPHETGTFDSFLQFVHPDDREYVAESIQASFTGAPYNIEARIVRKDGEERILRCKGELFFDENSQPLRMIGVNQDITELRQAEVALRTSETKLRIIEDSVHELITITDTRGVIEYASPSHKKILGFCDRYYQGRSSFSHFHPDDLPWLKEKFQYMLQHKVSIRGEYRRWHKDGYWVEVEGRGVPVLGDDGQVEKVVVVARDISERKKTEELLLKSEKLSIAGQLAAGIAHEIRNPLTAIKGFLQLMKYNKLENEGHINLMLDEMERIEMILSEMLVLAKPQANRFIEQDLEVILQEVLTLINSQALLHDIQIDMNISGHLPSITCDPNQLKQVFVNFLKNAIEAMPNGGVVKIEAQWEADERVLLRFIDEGCGISEEIVSRLGEPFYTTKEKGTGLGMMVSKRIIESHQGKLYVQSKLGAGTTIEVVLPCSPLLGKE